VNERGPCRRVAGPVVARVQPRPLLAAGALLTGLLLLLGAASLMVIDPAPSLADPGAGLGAASVALPAGALTPGQEMTSTVFLPLAIDMAPDPFTPNAWQGEYYANVNLSGQPAYTTEDEPRVDFDWGDGGAPAGLPADYFSVRWTGDWDFEAGKYTFFVYADDGVRLRLDGELLIDAWVAGIGSHSATVQVETEGPHCVQLDYFEQTGGAAVRLHWRRTGRMAVRANRQRHPIRLGPRRSGWAAGGWLFRLLEDAATV